MKKPILHILSDLAKIPNTSFYEKDVSNYIFENLKNFVDKIYYDEFGNLIAQKKGTKNNVPSFAFVSHMDHPGFEVIGNDNNKLKLKTLGGVSKYAGQKNNNLLLINSENKRIPITVSDKPKITNKLEAKREKEGWLGNEVIFSNFKYDQNLLNQQVIFDLDDFFIDEKKNIIHMRSADDLAGCSSILQALKNISHQNIDGDVFGIFTRAEEVGLLGAIALAESGLIPLETNIISVETSSIIPGVNLGNGVIIRTGDRISTFDDSAEKYLVNAANNLIHSNNEFKYQRNLMGAGGCEASAFKAFGYKVTGLAYPLGNWHNRGSKKVEEEYISLFDLITGQNLIEEVAKFSGIEYESFSEKIKSNFSKSKEIKRLKDNGSPKGI
ncbi:MAG: M20/M25/M40 family metallo-hydrolase [Dehalococcoidia bacterium]